MDSSVNNGVRRYSQNSAHELVDNKRTLTSKVDTTTGEKMPCDLWWGQVWHASYAEPLYVLKIRMKKEVGYLITNEPIKHEVQAWDIFFTYKRRWQIETSFRYGKCELAMESPRV